ncbi:MAG TPA: alpha/beta fold hydrolase [Blastocatellia bacterium]|nr:alpha/beta fold hydrolase [Blastocatellia bacterium]
MTIAIADFFDPGKTEMKPLLKLQTPFTLCILLLVLGTAARAQELKFADLGDFKLESGELLRDCRIGYRTFGTLNADKSNVILFPTWHTGTTEQLQYNFGPGKLVDSSKYYVIAVDALANGVSSSPSNSKSQPRMAFPKVTIRDMVTTQHALLTRILGLNHVKAVMGISMGGMQTFQWMVAYPEFMDKAIPIVGSPRLAPYDLLLWQSQINAIVNDPLWKNGNYSENPARLADAEFSALLLTTPDNYNKRMTRQQVFDELEKAKNGPGVDANDRMRQAQAMMALDVSQPFGGSFERAAAAVKAKVLVIVAKFDHVVTPGPATEFARQVHAKLLETESDCGHMAPSCEGKRINAAVGEFLDQ